MLNSDFSISKVNDLLLVSSNSVGSVIPSVQRISYGVTISNCNRTESVTCCKCTACQVLILNFSRTNFFKVEEVSVDTITTVENLSRCDRCLGDVIQNDVGVSQRDQTFKDHTEEGRTFVDRQSIHNVTNSGLTVNGLSQSTRNDSIRIARICGIDLNGFIYLDRLSSLSIQSIRINVECLLSLGQVVEDRRRCLKVYSYNLASCTRSYTKECITFNESIPRTSRNRTLHVDASDWISIRRNTCNTSSNVRCSRVEDVVQEQIVLTRLILSSTRSLGQNQGVRDIAVKVKVSLFDDSSIAIHVSDSLTKLEDGLIVDTINVQDVSAITSIEERNIFTTLEVSIGHVCHLDAVLGQVDRCNSCSRTCGLTSNSVTDKNCTKCATNVLEEQFGEGLVDRTNQSTETSSTNVNTLVQSKTSRRTRDVYNVDASSASCNNLSSCLSCETSNSVTDRGEDTSNSVEVQSGDRHNIEIDIPIHDLRIGSRCLREDDTITNNLIRSARRLNNAIDSDEQLVILNDNLLTFYSKRERFGNTIKLRRNIINLLNDRSQNFLRVGQSLLTEENFGVIKGRVDRLSSTKRGDLVNVSVLIDVYLLGEVSSNLTTRYVLTTSQ